MSRLILRPEACQDLAEAHEWYESHREGLGAEMAAAVFAAIEVAQSRPLSFPIRREPATRRVLVERFPYAVFFVFADDCVVVTAILHTSRDIEGLLAERN